MGDKLNQLREGYLEACKRGRVAKIRMPAQMVHDLVDEWEREQLERDPFHEKPLPELSITHLFTVPIEIDDQLEYVYERPRWPSFRIMISDTDAKWLQEDEEYMTKFLREYGRSTGI